MQKKNKISVTINPDSWSNWSMEPELERETQQKIKYIYMNLNIGNGENIRLIKTMWHSSLSNLE